MRVLLRTAAAICFFNCLAVFSLAQDAPSPNIALRVGAGNSISMKHFSQEETALNIPSSSFISIGLSTNILMRNNKSLFVGLEAQALNYYPTINEKTDLSYLSLLLGTTSRFDVAQRVCLKYTGGVSLSTLADVTSSVSGYHAYSGGPWKNVNLGLFNHLQILFSGEKAKDRNVEYGFGFDFGVNGVAVYKNASYPSYLRHNGFLQYGINLNMNYNFRRRFAAD